MIKIQLPFSGFHQSYDTDQARFNFERALSDKTETITDENRDEYWRIFHGEFDYSKYYQKISSLYANWLISSLYDNVTIVNVELQMPSSSKDTITVTLDATLEPLGLTLESDFETYAYRKFNIDYVEYGYFWALGELEHLFVNHMNKHGHYEALFWECLPKDLADYLRDGAT